VKSPKPEDAVSADEEIRNPLVLEFLNLKDEYSESDLEDALIRHLETSCSNSATSLRLSADKSGCGSATNGFGWTWCSSIGDCAAC
jgi:hypothetical protein